MDKGIKVHCIENIDLQDIAVSGLRALEASVSPEAYRYYLANTKDMDVWLKDIAGIVDHPNFVQEKRDATMADIHTAHQQGCVCEAVLNSCSLENKPGFALHRVLVLEIGQGEVILHDPVRPGDAPQPHRHVPYEYFEHAFAKGAAIATYGLAE